MTQKYTDMLFEDERMILLVVTIYLSFSTWLMENVKELIIFEKLHVIQLFGGKQFFR